ARGFHVAPQGAASTIATIEALRKLARSPVITVDIVADDYAHPGTYRDLAFLHGVTAFLPSNAEIERLWAPPDIAAWLAELAGGLGCHVAAKLGDQGSLVFDAVN